MKPLAQWIEKKFHSTQTANISTDSGIKTSVVFNDSATLMTRRQRSTVHQTLCGEKLVTQEFCIQPVKTYSLQMKDILRPA